MARTGNTEKWLRGDNTVNIFYAIYLYTKFDLNGNSSYTVICKVTKSSETTEWANSKVVVDKLIKLRMCLDPKDLNKYLQYPPFRKITSKPTPYGHLFYQKIYSIQWKSQLIC